MMAKALIFSVKYVLEGGQVSLVKGKEIWKVSRLGALALALMVSLVAAGLASEIKDITAGVQAEKLGHLNKAIRLYTIAINFSELSTTDMALAYTNRGRAWRLKGNLDRAIRDYTSALKVKPRYFIDFINRGFA